MAKSNSDRKGYMYFAGLGMSLCLEIAGAGLAGWWVGSLADRHWGMKPFGMITGIVVFLLVAFWHLIRELRTVERQMDQESESSDGN